MGGQVWPFVGREGDVEELVSLLLRPQRPATLLLRGAAGVGKTWLARALADRLSAAGREVVRLQATTGLSAIPFGALAPLVAAVDLADRPVGSAMPLADGTGGDLLAALELRLADREDLALVVDDVGRADPGSIAALHAAVASRRVPIVLTARDTDALPAELVALVDDGTIRQVDVEPLARTVCDELVAQALGGPLDPTAARQLHEASGGNPLFLRELVRGAVEADAVQPGPHGLVTGLLPSRRLVDLLDDRFGRLGPEERQVLELLAAGQPLAATSLATDAVERLESQGLVVVEDQAGPLLVRLGHPLYEEVLRATTPRVRWRRRSAEAAAILRAAGGEDERLRAVALAVASGAPTDADDLVAAARRASTLLDHDLALALADRAVDAGATSVGQQIRGAALSALSRADEAETALALALDDAVTDEEIARAAQPLAQHLAVRLGRASDAVARLDGAQRRISDPAWHAFLDADRIRWAMLAGEAAAFERPDDQDGVARLNGLMTEALVALMGGRLAVAEQAITEALPLASLHREVVGHGAELLLLSQCMAALFGGDLPAARRLAADEMARAGERNEEPVGMWAYALGVVDLHAGRAADAARWAALATRRLEWRDYTGLAPTARALHATALAQLGRVDDAAAVLAALAPEQLTDAWASLQGAQARAWLAVDEGDRERAAAIVAEHGSAGMDGGHLYLGALTSYAAVRIGVADPVLGDLVTAAGVGDGLLLPAFAAHATALAERRADALVDAAEALAALGVIGGAVDALDQAARLHQRSRRGELARQVRRRAAHLAEGCDTRRAGSDRATETLTTREREVSRLAADRLRSREIAERLGVSVRTVDNHLASAYRKLEVQTRDELAEALTRLGIDTDRER